MTSIHFGSVSVVTAIRCMCCFHFVIANFRWHITVATFQQAHRHRIISARRASVSQRNPLCRQSAQTRSPPAVSRRQSARPITDLCVITAAPGRYCGPVSNPSRQGRPPGSPQPLQTARAATRGAPYCQQGTSRRRKNHTRLFLHGRRLQQVRSALIGDLRD